MAKAKVKNHKTFDNPIGEQQKLANLQSSAQVNNKDINQEHNVKKEALGPNTRR